MTNEAKRPDIYLVATVLTIVGLQALGVDVQQLLDWLATQDGLSTAERVDRIRQSYHGGKEAGSIWPAVWPVLLFMLRRWRER